MGQGGGPGAEERAFWGGISPFWPRCASGSAGGRVVKPVKTRRWMEPCGGAGGVGGEVGSVPGLRRPEMGLGLSARGVTKPPRGGDAGPVLCKAGECQSPALFPPSSSSPPEAMSAFPSLSVRPELGELRAGDLGQIGEIRGFLLLLGFGAGFGPNAAFSPAPVPPAALDLGESEAASPSGSSFHPASRPRRCRWAPRGPGDNPGATPPVPPRRAAHPLPRPFQRGPGARLPNKYLTMN